MNIPVAKEPVAHDEKFPILKYDPQFDALTQEANARLLCRVRKAPNSFFCEATVVVMAHKQDALVNEPHTYVEYISRSDFSCDAAMEENLTAIRQKETW